jgi:hypothetical protein
MRLEAFVQKGDATDMQLSRYEDCMQNVAYWALFERNTYSAPLNGSAPPSRTSAIKPVAPLRKSTGVLAT